MACSTLGGAAARIALLLGHISGGDPGGRAFVVRLDGVGQAVQLAARSNLQENVGVWSVSLWFRTETAAPAAVFMPAAGVAFAAANCISSFTFLTQIS